MTVMWQSAHSLESFLWPVSLRQQGRDRFIGETAESWVESSCKSTMFTPSLTDFFNRFPPTSSPFSLACTPPPSLSLSPSHSISLFLLLCVFYLISHSCLYNFSHYPSQYLFLSFSPLFLCVFSNIIGLNCYICNLISEIQAVRSGSEVTNQARTCQ